MGSKINTPDLDLVSVRRPKEQPRNYQRNPRIAPYFERPHLEIAPALEDMCECGEERVQGCGEKFMNPRRFM